MRITIGLPFFNAQDTLLDAIRSVFAQSRDDWELLLVDDGSTDRSPDIARSVSDPRVRVYSDGKNLGLPQRLNQIIDMAHGDYIARMDADDLMHTDRIRRQALYLDSHPDIDLVSTGAFIIDSRSRLAGKRQCNESAITGRGLVAHQSLVHPAVMARTVWYRRNKYDPTFLRSQDYELWCRVCATDSKKTNFGKIKTPLYFLREEGSVTLAKMMAAYRANRKVLRLYGPALAGWGPTAMNYMKVILKDMLYRAFGIFGQEMLLVRQRNQPVSELESSIMGAMITRILETPVPGVDAGISKAA